MIYPSADTIESRVGSRYSLVVLAAKRAKQIKEGAPVLIETASTNPLTIALEEIAAGKVTIAEALPEGLNAIENEETVVGAHSGNSTDASDADAVGPAENDTE